MVQSKVQPDSNLLGNDKSVIDGCGILNHSPTRDIAQLRSPLIVAKEAGVVALDSDDYSNLGLSLQLLTEFTQLKALLTFYRVKFGLRDTIAVIDDVLWICFNLLV